jgi:hypothetical protein
MRIASKGNWNISGINKETDKVIYPFYNGFNTKEEAYKMLRALQGMDDKHIYIVIKNK